MVPAVVVLNYMTIKDTIEFVDSFLEFFKDFRLIIVDNGTPSELLTSLEQRIIGIRNISLHKTGRNLGFANGNNAGIRIALGEGYEYIACSNNDVLFKDRDILRVLKNDLDSYNASVAGPRIINLLGKNQNPLCVKRPTEQDIKKSLLYTSFAGMSLRKVFRNPKLKSAAKKILGLNSEASDDNNNESQSGFTYALHGSFLMFGPRFFEHYSGFDSRTFLYGEELILAEMLISKNLRAYYDSSVQILHKEDRTSDFLWGGQARLKPQLYARKSHRIFAKLWKKNNETSRIYEVRE